MPIQKKSGNLLNAPHTLILENSYEPLFALVIHHFLS